MYLSNNRVKGWGIPPTFIGIRYKNIFSHHEIPIFLLILYENGCLYIFPFFIWKKRQYSSSWKFIISEKLSLIQRNIDYHLLNQLGWFAPIGWNIKIIFPHWLKLSRLQNYYLKKPPTEVYFSYLNYHFVRSDYLKLSKPKSFHISAWISVILVF